MFSYFEALASQELLPSITDLEAAAIQLHRAYSSTTGLHRALRDASSPTDWSKQVPVGTPISNIVPAIDGGNGAEQFKGDLILARSIAFMRDTLISREAAYAAAEGDAGRLYEVTKVRVPV